MRDARHGKKPPGDERDEAQAHAAVALHFAHYIFVRLHRSLRVTPAMAAGVSDRLWSLEDSIIPFYLQRWSVSRAHRMRSGWRELALLR